MSESKPPVLIYCRDLFFAVRIRDVVKQLGGRPLVADSAEALAQGLREVPVLALIELGPGGQGAWMQAVQHARKWARGIPIIAFGSHVDRAAHAAARAAGCERVLARSRFVQELPALVARHVRPDPALDGCGDTLGPLVVQGLELFNRGEYYRCHDALEEAWMQDPRPCRHLYQGLLQLAIALHHIEQQNYAGAEKMFLRAIGKFQRLPARCQGLDVADLLGCTRRLLTHLRQLGPDQIYAFPRDLFPTLPYPDAQ